MSSDKLITGSAKHSKALAKSGHGRKAHAARVSETERRSASMQRKMMEPQVLDDKLLEAQRGKSNRDGRSMFPQAALQVGHFVKDDPEDTDFEIRRQLLKESQGTHTAYGQMTVGK